MSAERRRPWLLLLVGLLFAAWIGWLAYLAATTTRPIVLSRPQFLITQIDVVAELHAADDGGSVTRIAVKEVLFPVDGPVSIKPGAEIDIANLAHLTEHDGWQGPGEYILPLVKEGDHKVRLAPIPRTPGFGGGAPRIYRITPETRAQYRQIRGDSEQATFAHVVLVILVVLLIVFVVVTSVVFLIVQILVRTDKTPQ